MLRLAKYVGLILIVAYVGLYFLRERYLESAGVFLDEYVAGVAPWVLIVLLCRAVLVGRRRLKRGPRSVGRDGSAVR